MSKPNKKKSNVETLRKAVSMPGVQDAPESAPIALDALKRAFKMKALLVVYVTQDDQVKVETSGTVVEQLGMAITAQQMFQAKYFK